MFTIKQLGLHGVNLNGKGVVHVESDSLARKIRESVRLYVIDNPSATFKELAEVANKAIQPHAL